MVRCASSLYSATGKGSLSAAGGGAGFFPKVQCWCGRRHPEPPPESRKQTLAGAGRGAKRWEGERRKWRPRGRRECAEDRGGVLKRERVQRDPWPRRREARRREPLPPTQRTREEGRGPGPLAAARRSSVTRPPRADALTGRGLHVSGSAKACGSDPGEGGPRWRKRRSLPETQGQQRPGPW